MQEQLSLFDLFAAPVEDAPQTPAPDAAPVPVVVQASTIMPDGRSFRVYGVVRGLTVIPSAWRPSARDVLSLFPVIHEYYMPKGLFDRDCTVSLGVHEVGADGRIIDGGQMAALEFDAAELCDAAESF